MRTFTEISISQELKLKTRQVGVWRREEKGTELRRAKWNAAGGVQKKNDRTSRECESLPETLIRQVLASRGGDWEGRTRKV